MEMYYVTGKYRNVDYVHFEIKEAYDNQIPTSEWIQTHKKDKLIVELLLSQCIFPIAMSMQYITRISPLQASISDILTIAKSLNITLIQNNSLSTCLYIPSTLVVRQNPLDIYYEIVYDKHGYQNLLFGFKKYVDNNKDTYDSTHLATQCFDFDANLGCSKEYQDFIDTLDAFGCPESQECVYELAIPINVLEPLLNQYGYNLIQHQLTTNTNKKG